MSDGAIQRKKGSGLPSDKICLQLIWVTLPVKRLDFFFTPDDTAAYICQYVFDHWPEEWADEPVTSANVLKLIYQGRFLHGSVSIGALNLPLGKRSVMHLVARENLPEPPSQGQTKRVKTERRSCCCNIL